MIVIGTFYLLSSFQVGAHDSDLSIHEQEQKDHLQLSYDIRVVVNVIEVIVTDKKGKRVTGLKPENFEVYEDGIPQKLTNFYEVKDFQVFGFNADEEKETLKKKPSSLPEETKWVENKIIFFFDNWHLHPQNRNWITKKLKTFIKKNFSSDKSNQGMVVLLDHHLEIIQDFTSYPNDLLNGVDRIKNYTGEAISRMKEREDLSRELNKIAMEADTFGQSEYFQRSLGYARNFIEAEMYILNFIIKSLDAFINYLSGIEGRKILIYVCDGLPVNPGREIFSFIDQIYPLGNAQIEAMNYDATPLFKELTARCNARKISIYPINAEAFEEGFDSADRDRSWTTKSSGISLFNSNLSNERDSLKIMAEETGGNAVLSSSGVNKGLKILENDLYYFYSLGYKSPSRADGKYHPIDVKLVGEDESYNIRIKKGYIKTSPSQKIKENVIARLFIPNTKNPLGIKVKDLSVEKHLSGKIKLTIKILIPLNKITLLPQKKEYTGEIKVTISCLDSKKFWSEPYELVQEIKIPEKDYEKARNRYFPYLTELHLEPDNYLISLAVTDMMGQTTSYIQLQKDLSK